MWQLEEKAELNAHVQVLPFQREDRDVAADTVCEVAGWGTISHSGRQPDKLYQVERPVISRDVCNHRTRHDHTITEKMMCTDSRRKDTCKVPLALASRPLLSQTRNHSQTHRLGLLTPSGVWERGGWVGGYLQPGRGGSVGLQGRMGLYPQGDGGSLPCAGRCTAALVSLEIRMRPRARPSAPQGYPLMGLPGCQGPR